MDIRIESRFPRLLRAMRWAAILSETEAKAALRDYLATHWDGKRWGGGEAVVHFGGPLAVIQAAIRVRRHTYKRS